MSMGRNIGRGKPKKSAGDVLLVAVEGKTEEDYFSALRRRYRIPGQRLMVHNVGNGPAFEVGRFLKGLSDNRRYRVSHLPSTIGGVWRTPSGSADGRIVRSGLP